MSPVRARVGITNIFFASRDLPTRAPPPSASKETTHTPFSPPNRPTMTHQSGRNISIASACNHVTPFALFTHPHPNPVRTPTNLRTHAIYRSSKRPIRARARAVRSEVEEQKWPFSTSSREPKAAVDAQDDRPTRNDDDPSPPSHTLAHPPALESIPATYTRAHRAYLAISHKGIQSEVESAPHRASKHRARLQ